MTLSRGYAPVRLAAGATACTRPSNDGSAPAPNWPIPRSSTTRPGAQPLTAPLRACCGRRGPACMAGPVEQTGPRVARHDRCHGACWATSWTRCSGQRTPAVFPRMLDCIPMRCPGGSRSRPRPPSNSGTHCRSRSTRRRCVQWHGSWTVPRPSDTRLPARADDRRPPERQRWTPVPVLLDVWRDGLGCLAGQSNGPRWTPLDPVGP